LLLLCMCVVVVCVCCCCCCCCSVCRWHCVFVLCYSIIKPLQSVTHNAATCQHCIN